MDVLLIGGGGREHALAWALSRSPRVGRLVCLPGNAGIAAHADCVNVPLDDLDAVMAHVRQAGYDLVVVGPEAPLVAGLADRLEAAGVAVFGPSAAAARIEGSKAFAKELMGRHGIPTARYRLFDDASRASAYLGRPDTPYPLVVKADGLAAGKGVILASGAAEAIAAASEMLDGSRFGPAGSRIVVEELLRGREVSFFALCDGEHFVELATCQDYKRVRDGDRGPNTGGMGAYSPSVHLDETTRKAIVETAVRPAIRGLAAEGIPYRGVLYVGLMLTSEGPRVLEFNARFGDPETQALIPRLEGDWLDLMYAAATGRLEGVRPIWKPGASVCVVMASAGYPAAQDKGKAIEGIERAESMAGVTVFHAGTALDDRGRLVTTGGRVLGVTALGGDLSQARSRAYDAVQQIRWHGEHHRGDIAADAVRQAAIGGGR